MIWRLMAMITFGASAAVLGIWTAEREPPTYVARVEVVTPQVATGGEFKIKYTVQRRKSCHVRVERLMIDSQLARFVMPPTEFQGVPLGDDAYISVLKVPEEAARGQAKYYTVTTYKCNPLHGLWPVVVIAPPVWFEIM